jgi:hypothetical protein
MQSAHPHCGTPVWAAETRLLQLERRGGWNSASNSPHSFDRTLDLSTKSGPDRPIGPPSAPKFVKIRVARPSTFACYQRKDHTSPANHG